MPRIICPFCTHTHDMTRLECPEHPDDANFKIPRKYVDDYRRTPPLWLMTIGFSKHGKTTYLATLTMMLERLGDVIPDVWYWTMDAFTFDEVRKMRKEMREGHTVGPTQTGEPLRPLLFQINNMPTIPSRCLVLYDVAGEHFDDFGGIEKQAANMRQVNTAWFLVSLPDLQKGTKRIYELFMVYLTGLQQIGVDYRGWNIIVVYTKADSHQFGSDYEPAKKVDDYIRDDPLHKLSPDHTFGPSEVDEDVTDIDASFFENYVDDMREISDVLEQYTVKNVSGGNAFVAAVRNNGMNLVFSATSALGQSPRVGSKTIDFAVTPRRVIDALLWALQLEAPNRDSKIRLLVDTSAKTVDLFEEGMVAQVWEALSDHGEVSTYLLGQSKATSAEGQPPPTQAPKRARPRLVGPLLDVLRPKPEPKLVILTTGPIYDLGEYNSALGRKSILLLKVENDFATSWRNTRMLRLGDDPSVVIEDLKTLPIEE